MQADYCPTRAYPGRNRTFVRRRRVEFGRNGAESGQVRANRALSWENFGPNRPPGWDLGRFRTMLRRFRPSSTNVGPRSTNFGQSSGKLDQPLPNLYQHLARIRGISARNQPSRARHPPTSTPSGPKSAKIGPNTTRLAQHMFPSTYQHWPGIRQTHLAWNRPITGPRSTNFGPTLAKTGRTSATFASPEKQNDNEPGALNGQLLVLMRMMIMIMMLMIKSLPLHNTDQAIHACS